MPEDFRFEDGDSFENYSPKESSGRIQFLSKPTKPIEVVPGIYTLPLDVTKACFEKAKMSQPHPHAEYGRQVMEMLESLNVAAHEAHRRPFTIEELRSMTVETLILQLASNNVRFVYQKKD